MAELSSFVDSPAFREEFERLLDYKLMQDSCKSYKTQDPDIDPNTPFIKFFGTSAFKCTHKKRSYHLKVRQEKCNPSHHRWLLL